MFIKKTSVKHKINQVRKYLFVGATMIFFLFHWPIKTGAAIPEPIKKAVKGSVIPSSQQNQNKDIKDFFLYGDYVYSNNIQTILFYKKGWDMAPPHIRFESDEQLILRFDDLDADYKDYYYTIIHCDAYWTPTPLQSFEYIDGFNEDMIRDYSRSINTVVPYTQYYLEFPSYNLRPRLSGNYILKVYLNGNPDDVVFTRRFMVFEQQVGIEGDVRQATLVRYRDSHQQLSFAINTLDYYISNPGQDMKLVITQNGRWDNAIIGIQPRMIQGNRFVYDYEQELLFEGGNEFRRFDIRSLRFLSERIADISSSPRHWEVFLLNDPLRSARRYSSDGDINGRYNIKNVDFNDDMLESDYAWVYFSLPMNAPVDNATVHVMGALTNWNLTRDNEMVYNSRARKYETSLLLKQGYYNYQYVVLDDGSSMGRVSEIEGSFSEAENDYSIFVYHRQPGTLHDRLIGIRHFNTAARQISPR
ncbi:MAG: DUF5103 domain-containing protein [Bacteroides sp.]|jgi:hypothetical protein|nr:DUF5103 domain-containing protein [Bacteroides sp.]